MQGTLEYIDVQKNSVISFDYESLLHVFWKKIEKVS